MILSVLGGRANFFGHEQLLNQSHMSDDSVFMRKSKKLKKSRGFPGHWFCKSLFFVCFSQQLLVQLQPVLWSKNDLYKYLINSDQKILIHLILLGFSCNSDQKFPIFQLEPLEHVSCSPDPEILWFEIPIYWNTFYSRPKVTPLENEPFIFFC